MLPPGACLALPIAIVIKAIAVARTTHAAPDRIAGFV
jgi:hypothetical protein